MQLARYSFRIRFRFPEFHEFPHKYFSFEAATLVALIFSGLGTRAIGRRALESSEVLATRAERTRRRNCRFWLLGKGTQDDSLNSTRL